MHFRIFVVAITTLFLFGCATPNFSDREFPMADADLEISAAQQEILVEPSQTDPMMAGGGLLGVLIATSIDSTRDRRADELIVPIRDKLVDYAVGQRFVERVEASGVASRLAVAPAVVRTDEVILSELSPTQPMLLVQPRVHFNNPMTALMVDLRVDELLPNEVSDSPRQGAGQLYRFFWPLPTEGRLSRDEAAEQWMEWSHDELVALIERGMDETLKMMEAHLQETVLVFANSNAQWRVRHAGRFRLWRMSEDMKWLSFRDRGTAIYAVPQHAIL